MPSLITARTQFQANLAANGYVAGTPAHDIVAMPGRELWRSAMVDSVLATALCHNFFDYGRTHNWQWVQRINGNGTPAQGDLGIPLLQGTITATNCGGFNGSLRRLAHDILGLAGMTQEGTTDTFITVPGTNVIDTTWTGNVRTLNQDFNQLRSYFFVGHSWNRLDADHYDGTTHQVNFHGAQDLYWCKLSPRPGCLYDAWSVTVLQPIQPFGPPPYLCIRVSVLKELRHLFPVVAVLPFSGVTQTFINSLRDSNGGWSTLLLVSRHHLPPEFRRKINYP